MTYMYMYIPLTVHYISSNSVGDEAKHIPEYFVYTLVAIYRGQQNRSGRYGICWTNEHE